jgi:hypothetical protein
MNGTRSRENLEDGADVLAALAQLGTPDVDAHRAVRIRSRCLARLPARPGRRGRMGARWLRSTWRVLEPVLVSGTVALYLLAVLQRAALLRAG